jgi:hypothetical protein
MFVGLDSFHADVKAWVNSVEKAAQEAAAGLGQIALTYILEEGPQYSGDFVAGWEVGFNVPVNIWRPPQSGGAALIKKGLADPLEKGDPYAIDYALNKAYPRFEAAAKQPLGTPIFLSNSAVHDEPYAWKIERNEINFRPENPDAGRLVGRSVDYVGRRFATIGRSQLSVLRSLGV